MRAKSAPLSTRCIGPWCCGFKCQIGRTPQERRVRTLPARSKGAGFTPIGHGPENCQIALHQSGVSAAIGGKQDVKGRASVRLNVVG